MECEKGIATVPFTSGHSRRLYDSWMNLDMVFSPGTKSVVGMTVFATVSMLARFAGHGRRTHRLTIEWE